MSVIFVCTATEKDSATAGQDAEYVVKIVSKTQSIKAVIGDCLNFQQKVFKASNGHI